MDAWVHICMFCDCPEVNKFWRQVSTILKDILDLKVACCPRLLLLTDDSLCTFSLTQKKLFFCGLTLAKKCAGNLHTLQHGLTGCSRFWALQIWSFQQQDYMELLRRLGMDRCNLKNQTGVRPMSYVSNLMFSATVFGFCFALF